MKSRLKKLLSLLFVFSLVFTACGNSSEEIVKDQETAQEVEEEKDEETEQTTTDLEGVQIGYMFSNHQAPLIVAAGLGEKLGDGAYLEEVIPKEEYLVVDENGKKAFYLNLVVGDNGGELMTLMNQDRLDMAFGSVGLPLTNIDEGSHMKVLSPIHVDGIGLIMLPDQPVDNFEDFINFVGESEEPVIIGYHSPQNAPVILFSTAMKEEGYIVTEDPTKEDADILLVNLKGTGNLIPSLQNGEVHAFIGPSPFPELAVLEETGKLIVDLKDLPPKGKWENFPCCVTIASDQAIENKSEEIKIIFDILSRAADFANNDKVRAGEIIAEWMGVDQRAAENTNTVYTTDPTETWFKNFNVTYESLQEDGALEGILKDRSLEEAYEDVFYLDFANEYHGHE